MDHNLLSFPGFTIETENNPALSMVAVYLLVLYEQNVTTFMLKFLLIIVENNYKNRLKTCVHSKQNDAG